MQKRFHILFAVCFFGSVLMAQESSDIESFGFIDIKTDSLDVPFFVDGYFVGKHPLKGPIPVLPGFHEVSYIPPDIQHEKIKENLSEGIKRIYVAENDTLDVFLFYDHYLAQIETVQKEMRLQQVVGLSLVGVLMFIIFSLF